MKVLRQLFMQFFSERNYCGLDIGSQKTKASFARVEDVDHLQFMAVNEGDTHGLKKTAINDIAEFSGALGVVLDGIVRKTKIRFRDLHLGIGGELVETRMSKAVIPLVERGNKVIVPSDVKAARHQARLLGVRLDEEVVCDLVRQFKVDDINIANNPVGLFGRKLEVEVLLVVINITRFRNITKAVRQSGYEINKVFYNGEVLSQMALDKQQRAQGCVLIDLGAHKTEIMIFKDGLLKHFSVPVFGGERMTQHLATALGIPLTLAEDLKKEHAKVGGGIFRDDEEILIKKEQGHVPIGKKAIADALEDDVQALIEHIRDAITASGYEGQLKAGIVMAGGGALLSGLMERVESALNMPVVLARNIPGLPSSSVVYAVSTSLCEAGYKGSLRYIFDRRTPKDWLETVRFWFKDICNEYF